jgi:hypothetical protein
MNPYIGMASIVSDLAKEGKLNAKNLGLRISTPKPRNAAKRKLLALGHSEADVAKLLARTYVKMPGRFEKIYGPLRAKLQAGTARTRDVILVSDQLLGDTTSLGTKATRLAQLRKAMKADGASQALIIASYRPQLTQANNEVMDEARVARENVPIRILPRFADLAGLERSVGEIPARLAQGLDIKMQLMDLLVAASARPGELSTMEIESLGDGAARVRGILKKQVPPGEEHKWYPYVSAIQPHIAAQALRAFQNLPAGTQAYRIEQMRQSVKDFPTWAGDGRPNQLRDLRSIGAFLAADSRGYATDAQKMRLTAQALRHEYVAPTMSHYANVVRR